MSLKLWVSPCAVPNESVHWNDYIRSYVLNQPITTCMLISLVQINNSDAHTEH